MALQCGDCKEVNQDKEFEFSQIWDAFNTLRLQSQLCDVVLCVGDRRFECHRAILAANSPYFRAMFTNGMQETEKREIPMKNVDPDMLALIIEYIYTRSVRVNMDNVMCLLSLADCFSVDGLTDTCVEYMKSALGLDNCFSVLRFSRVYYRVDLATAAKDFITENFAQLTTNKCKEFLECAIEDLIDVLGDDHLNVSEEQEVFEAAIEWVQYNEEDRKRHVPELLQQVRLCHVNPSDLLDRISINRLCNSPASEDVISLSYEYILNAKKLLRKKKDLTNPLLRPRIPHGVLFAVGGWSGGTPISKIEVYDCKSDQWYTFEDLQDSNPRAYHGLVVYNKRIYIIGGFNGTEYYNSVRYYDPIKKTWHDASPMYTPRCYVSTALLRDYIYACGGYDGRFRLNTVEKFHPPSNQWTKLPSMMVKRSDAGSEALNGRLYVAGGFNGEQCLSTAEVYDPDFEQWSMIHPMSCPRSGVAVTAFNGSLYAIGGFDGESRLKTAERYNHLLNSWEKIPDMFSQRSNCAAAVLDGMLIAMGGFNGTLTISRAECFDDETNMWYEATEMSVNRSALKAVVIHGLPNSKDYTYHGMQNLQEKQENSDCEEDQIDNDMLLD